MSDPVLSADRVEVRFDGGRVRAVDNVSLEVGRGEVVALVGESGCGKTTFIRSVVGLEPLSAGHVRVGGVDVTGGSKALRAVRRIAQIVFQDPTGALNPRHSVYEAIAEGLRIHRVPGDEASLVADALSAAGLRPPERFMTRFPHELSGGQRQRVLIAGAMALRPALILADEPVASLDASIRGEILALMRQFVDTDGVSIVAVTHDLGLAWNIADRVAVMYLGRIVEIGPTETVLRAPMHPYTRALLSVVPEVGGMTPEILVGETPDPRRIASGCRFHPRCPLVANGEAERLGIIDRCRGVDVELGVVEAGHSVACHAVRVRPSAP
jgi:oligopeptide/dipeptide ABC transporter ATP-binding protein